MEAWDGLPLVFWILWRVLGTGAWHGIRYDYDIHQKSKMVTRLSFQMNGWAHRNPWELNAGKHR